jgi:hypothetical protein
MSIAQALGATASRLLDRFGQSMTLKHQDGDPVYDPATGEVTAAQTAIQFSGYARSPTGQDLLDGSVAQSDLIVIARVPVASANDVLTIGADTYRVKVVRRPAVAEGVDVILELVVSK